MKRHEPYVYFLRPTGALGPVKIGFSGVPYERLSVCQSWSPVKLELAARMPGGEDLERRFHARFRDQHSHGEWFLECAELTEVIARVVAGTFDPAELPTGRRLPPGKKRDRAAVEAGIYHRRLTTLRCKHRVDVPQDVYEASFTYQADPEEKAQMRAKVRAYVDAHWPPQKAA